MIMRLFFPLLLLFPLSLCAQQKDAFPASWAGHWAGKLEIITPRGVMQQVPMEMEITPSDTTPAWHWRSTFNPGAENEVFKDYLLRPRDPGGGIYLMDELNTIAIEAYLFEGCRLFSWFEVQGSLIQAVYELRPDGSLLFEIVAGSMEPVSVTGDSLFQGDSIPSVQTFPLRSIQRAVLQKKANPKTKD